MKGKVWLKCMVREKQPFQFVETVLGCDLSVNVWKEQIFELEYQKGSRDQHLNDIMNTGIKHLRLVYGVKNVQILSYWEIYEEQTACRLHTL